MSEPLFQTKDFHGTVVLEDWFHALNGRQYRGITGSISVLRDEELVGFKVRGQDCNWAVRVVGPGQAWTFPGCKVRAVVAHDTVVPEVPEYLTIV